MEALKRRVGPFTIGVWLAIGLGGVLLGLVVRRFMGPSADAEPIEAGEAATPAFGFLTAGATTVPLNGGTTGGYGGADVDPKTNEDWIRAGVLHMASKGYDSLEVDTALRNYVYGYDMTSAQGAIVSMVIKQVGPAPEGVAPAKVTPVPGKPATPTTQVPPTTAKLTPEGTLWVAQALHLIDKMNRNQKMSRAELDQAWGMGVRPDDPRLNETGRQVSSFYKVATGN